MYSKTKYIGIVDTIKSLKDRGFKYIGRTDNKMYISRKNENYVIDINFGLIETDKLPDILNSPNDT